MTHSRFTGVVRGLWLRVVRGVCADARDEEDAASRAGVAHIASSGLRTEEGAVEVDVDYLAELGGCGVEGGDAADDAGEAAEDVDGAEEDIDTAERLVHRLWVCYIDWTCHDFTTWKGVSQAGDGVI